MGATKTLNSRLRVLVAKTYRAEQLYSSIRNVQLGSYPSLSEVANDVRAKVWQQAYAELRADLNELLMLPGNRQIIEKILQLRFKFEARAQEAVAVVSSGVEQLSTSAERNEFAHTLKLSMELVEQKARGQANQVIADELGELLDASKRNQVVKKIVAESPQQQEASAKPAVNERPSNVIPFRRVASR